MYLARISIKGIGQYLIRQSYFDKTSKNYRYRTLFDLGADPSSYIHLVSDEVCYFSSELEKCLDPYADTDPSNLLEDLLWDFIPFDVQQRLSYFRGRGYTRRGPFSAEDKKQVQQQVHMFDKRRIYYLRLGAVDQSRIDRMPEKLLRPLLGQCRDEREFYFQKQERSLNQAEYKSYVFSIFNLQHHFSQSYSTFMPEGLNQDVICDHFIEAICKLNASKQFWKTDRVPTHLHQHLVHYLIMFFDYDFSAGVHTNEYIRQFMNNHRTFRWPDKKQQISDDQIQAIFGKSLEQLKKLARSEFIKLFRKKAKELHPDKGGNHEQFVILVEIYNGLLKSRSD